jgi:hypothetical protein
MLKKKFSIGKISFILGLPIIHYNRSRQEYHKINFQVFSGRFFERYATKDRTHAIAVGLGVSYNNYIQNLAITGTGSCLYSVIDGKTVFNKTSSHNC